MLSVIIGAFLGISSLSLLVDTIFSTDVSAWFFEEIGNIVMLFVHPVIELFLYFYDAILAVVKGFFTG